jgi:hypothetical protein
MSDIKTFPYRNTNVKLYNSKEELVTDFPVKSDFKCPECKNFYCPSDDNCERLKGQTEIIFRDDKEGYIWYEGIECKCGTKYHICNGV